MRGFFFCLTIKATLLVFFGGACVADCRSQVTNKKNMLFFCLTIKASRLVFFGGAGVADCRSQVVNSKNKLSTVLGLFCPPLPPRWITPVGLASEGVSFSGDRLGCFPTRGNSLNPPSRGGLGGVNILFSFICLFKKSPL